MNDKTPTIVKVALLTLNKLYRRALLWMYVTSRLQQASAHVRAATRTTEAERHSIAEHWTTMQSLKGSALAAIDSSNDGVQIQV